MTESELWFALAVIALVTALTRFLPFFVFSSDKGTPRIIVKLGELLPYAIMGMLVVYCLKEVRFCDGVGGFMPEFISVTLVAAVHFWKRNTLLSIVLGTVCYMILVQLVF